MARQNSVNYTSISNDPRHGWLSLKGTKITKLFWQYKPCHLQFGLETITLLDRTLSEVKFNAQLGEVTLWEALIDLIHWRKGHSRLLESKFPPSQIHHHDGGVDTLNSFPILNLWLNLWKNFMAENILKDAKWAGGKHWLAVSWQVGIIFPPLQWTRVGINQGRREGLLLRGFFCFSWIFILTIHHQLFHLKFFTEKYQYLPNQATLVLKEVLFWQLSHPFLYPLLPQRLQCWQGKHCRLFPNMSNMDFRGGSKRYFSAV